MDFEELQSLNIFTKEQFEIQLNTLIEELVQKAGDSEIDYRAFIRGRDVRGEGRPSLPRRIPGDGGKGERQDRPDDREDIHLAVSGKAGPETKSVAIEII